MYQENILASGTGAGISNVFRVERGKPVTVAAFGTFGSDVGVLERQSTANTWEAQFAVDGTALSLAAALTAFEVVAPGNYRINFADRTGAIGVDKQY